MGIRALAKCCTKCRLQAEWAARGLGVDCTLVKGTEHPDTAAALPALLR